MSIKHCETLHFTSGRTGRAGSRRLGEKPEYNRKINRQRIFPACRRLRTLPSGQAVNQQQSSLCSAHGNCGQQAQNGSFLSLNLSHIHRMEASPPLFLFNHQKILLWGRSCKRGARWCEGWRQGSWKPRIVGLIKRSRWGAGSLEAGKTCPCVCLLPKAGCFTTLRSLSFFVVSDTLASL